MYVFAFDRGWTLDCAPPQNRESVPTGWVRELAADPDCTVYALCDRLATDLDLAGPADLLDGDAAPDCERRELLHRIHERHPEADAHIVVDDIDLSDVPGWAYYTGWEFVAAAEAGDLPVAVGEILEDARASGEADGDEPIEPDAEP